MMMFSVILQWINAFWTWPSAAVAVLSCCLLAWYKYLTWNHNYWIARGLPQVTPIPILGSGWTSFRYSLSEAQNIHAKKYGRVYGAYSGRKPSIMVADAQLIRAICVKDFNHFVDRFSLPFLDKFFANMLMSLKGEEWKRVRSIISPTFSSGKLKRMYPIMDECAADLLQHIKSQIDDQERGIITLKDAFGNFTMDVIARCAFAIRTKSGTDNSNQFVKHAVSFFNPNLWRIFALILLPQWFTQFFDLGFLNKACTAFFMKTSTEIIEDRRSRMRTNTGNKLPVDFVHLMLEAVERKSSASSGDQSSQTEQDLGSHHVNETAEEREVYRKTISQYGSSGSIRLYLEDHEMIAQACLFLVAGYETTSSVLSFTAYALAQNPEIQERLHQELVSLDFDSSNEINYDAIFQCTYLDAVLNETMRLHTPLSIMDRVATRDYRLPEPYSHITLKTGTHVQLCFHAIHHDSEYWPEPYRFDPERFMPENAAQIVPYSFTPFGAGPRNCIAMRFALMEVKLALARVVLNFKFAMTADTPRGPLQYSKMSAILKPVTDIKLSVEARA